jgi:hypothetical protein
MRLPDLLTRFDDALDWQLDYALLDDALLADHRPSEANEDATGGGVGRLTWPAATEWAASARKGAARAIVAMWPWTRSGTLGIVSKPV